MSFLFMLVLVAAMLPRFAVLIDAAGPSSAAGDSDAIAALPGRPATRATSFGSARSRSWARPRDRSAAALVGRSPGGNSVGAKRRSGPGARPERGTHSRLSISAQRGNYY